MFILKLIEIWICLSLVLASGLWLAVKIISSLYPEWWRRNVVDLDRDFIECRSTRRPSNGSYEVDIEL
jgi:hypothetical protein